MSIQEREEYGKALALIERHGMVAVTEERMQQLRAVVKAAKRACDAHSWGGIPHEEANELAEALEALDASSTNQDKC